MIIGLDISAMSTRNTGTSRYIQCLLSQLNNTNEEIKTFPMQQINMLPQANWLSAIPIIKRGGIYRHLSRTFVLTSEMNRSEVDFGIFPNYLMPLNFDKPSLIVIHDLSFYSHPQFYSKPFVWYYKHQLKNILKKKPMIATVSEHSKLAISKYLEVDKESIFLLQPFVDESAFVNMSFAQNKTNDPHYFLYVGHIEPRKNLGFLIGNFVRWKKTNHVNMKLKIAGEIWLRSKEIQILLDEYTNHPDVEITGYVEEEQLHQLYAKASGFVHSSIVEGFGFPVLEAMHYGLPILCSSGTSTEEISKPYSITASPFDETELMIGFDRLFEKSLEVRSEYKIEYSSSLMSKQLDQILSSVNNRGKKIFYMNKVSDELVEQAVEKTLLYYKLFNSGLNAEKLHNFLLELNVTKQQLIAGIETLLDKNAIIISENNISLNAEVNSFYSTKNKSLDPRLANRLLKIIKKIPFITLIAFSGGTANYGLDNHDDIDLFIVTKPHSVYLVYMLIHFISLLFNSRNILCINYLIDEREIQLKNQYDLYIAHQILSLKPFKNEQYLKYFLSKNKWVTDFYPNYEIPNHSYKQSSFIYHLIYPINSILKYLYRWWYKKYLSFTDSTAVILSGGVIKLHTRDYRKKVLQEFSTEWTKYLKNKVTAGISSAVAK